MRKQETALTIAGSDSGGGAGLQADLKAFAAVGVHGTSVVACLTAQNPKAVLGSIAVDPAFVRQQLEAVFAELPPRAIKTGMLFSTGVIEVVSEFLFEREIPLVVDPVMAATSGGRLLQPGAMAALRRLFTLATLITPNIDEAEALLGAKLTSPEDLRLAAKALHEQYGCAALVKGGHLRGLREAIDFYYDGAEELMLSAPFVKGVATHGTGCTYSAAITGHLALGLPLRRAVAKAKEYITAAIAGTRSVGKNQALGWFQL